MSCKNFHDYIVYDDGRIYSTKTNKFLRFDCYGKYAKVTLSIDKKPVRYSVHRLIAYLFRNPPPNYRELDVDHLDNDHFNNAEYNLEWVTGAENNRRARQNGTNNISLSNSVRWNDGEFRNRTAKNISEGQIASVCFSGKRNPRHRFEILLSGEDVKEFTACGIISITDLKSKVNRLSKA